jgi:hypothetical protein
MVVLQKYNSHACCADSIKEHILKDAKKKKNDTFVYEKLAIFIDNT